VKIVLQIALGIIAAIGGFVDIGDLVFNVQAGATFGYQLIWAVLIGVVGIMVYAEMCGRVAAVTGRPVFDLIRERMGFSAALVTLVASLIINLMTLGAEIGGVALILELLVDAPVGTLAMLGVIGLGLLIWWAPFGALERIFGYGGLMLFVFVVAAVQLQPDWGDVAHGIVPQAKSSTLYFFVAVGLISAALLPYEVYFYSSGAVEEQWGPKDLKVNRLNAIIGYGIGGILSIALMMVAAQAFEPNSIDPGHLGSVALGAQVSLGEAGLVLGLLGMLFAIGGAAIDASFAAAYSVAQFAGWEWGKYRTARGAPRFTLAWMLFLALGLLAVSTGIDPIQLTELSVVFSVVALPLTYLPVLLIARDRTYMGEHVNGRFGAGIAWVYFAIICVLAVAAVPLLLATNGGGG
jgi:Mn2+/Fe2+ NRAMP family transporter